MYVNNHNIYIYINNANWLKSLSLSKQVVNLKSTTKIYSMRLVVVVIKLGYLVYLVNFDKFSV